MIRSSMSKDPREAAAKEAAQSPIRGGSVLGIASKGEQGKKHTTLAARRKIYNSLITCLLSPPLCIRSHIKLVVNQSSSSHPSSLSLFAGWQSHNNAYNTRTAYSPPKKNPPIHPFAMKNRDRTRGKSEEKGDVSLPCWSCLRALADAFVMCSSAHRPTCSRSHTLVERALPASPAKGETKGTG